jgi:signal peptidase II
MMKRISLLLLIAVTVLVTDGVVKQWIERSLAPGDVIPVMGETFRLTLAYNTGVAFGMLGNGGRGLLVLTGTIVVVLSVWAIYNVYASATPRFAFLPLGLLLGGAIANFVDRALDGHVTDFLDVGLVMRRFPTFNLADCAIVVGVGLLMLLFWSRREPQVSEVSVTPSGSL